LTRAGSILTLTCLTGADRSFGFDPGGGGFLGDGRLNRFPMSRVFEEPFSITSIRSGVVGAAAGMIYVRSELFRTFLPDFRFDPLINDFEYFLLRLLFLPVASIGELKPIIRQATMIAVERRRGDNWGNSINNFSFYNGSRFIE
jgi:hypothetical protein